MRETPVLTAQMLPPPAPAKRPLNVAANFLWDNSGYLLGIDEKGNPERAKTCFAASRELRLRLLKDVQTPAAQAVVAFF